MTWYTVKKGPTGPGITIAVYDDECSGWAKAAVTVRSLS